MKFDPQPLRDSLPPLAQALLEDDRAQGYRAFYGLPASRLGVFSAAGFQLAGQVWMPSAPVATLVLVHGYYDHMGLYKHLVNWALARQWAVLAFDLPGHGLSSGARASIGNFTEYQQALDAALAQAAQAGLPHPWHVLGQSTGGAIVIDHLLHNGIASPLDGQAMLLAPLVRPRGWWFSRLSYLLLRPFISSLARGFSENTHDPAFMPFLQADPMQPLRLPTLWVGALDRWIRHIEAAPASEREVLIVQGEGDMTVDWRYNLAVLKRKLPRAQVLLLPEGRHHLANETLPFRQRYLAFFDARV